jgi:preprotein translocase subunit SecF
MEFFSTPNLNFIGAMKVAGPISGILVVLSLLVILVVGPEIGIDFVGGTLVQVRVTPQVDIGELRGVLERSGFADAGVQDMAGTHEYLITYNKAQGDLEADASTGIVSALRNGLSGRTIELRRQESVGPKIGSELRTAAANAMALAMVLMVVYMWFRFVLRYGIAAVIALAHDVIITLGIFVLLHKEVSLQIVAAFLTLIGYSINDKIVVFDRIRENMRLRRKESYRAIINRSINETLSRTCLTSTVLMATACLWAFGGPVIRDFAFVMTLGVIIGTYSSAFIGSGVLVFWYERFIADRKRVQPSM